MEHTLSARQQCQLDHIKSAMESNLPLTQYAKQNNLDVKALYNWKCVFVRKGLIAGKKKKAFTKVSPEALKSELVSQQPSTTAVLPNGIVLNFSELSVAMLRLLKAL